MINDFKNENGVKTDTKDFYELKITNEDDNKNKDDFKKKKKKFKQTDDHSV